MWAVEDETGNISNRGVGVECADGGVNQCNFKYEWDVRCGQIGDEKTILRIF